MTLLWFQETLKSFFSDRYESDMDTIMKHRQVVILICGLMSDPSPVMHYVCKHWIRHGHKSEGKTLIGLMYNETGSPVPKDFLHNKWINYYDHRFGSITDATPVYVLSRWYWFKGMKLNIVCNIQHETTDIPECTMSIIDPDPSVTENLLSICHRICQHQTVRNLYIDGIRCEDLPHVFTINKNTESLTIRSCKLPTETLSHLMQQINDCSPLRVLDLSATTLTGCLSSFVADSHPRLPQLEVLHLSSTALNREDLQHLSSVVYKLPKLGKLDLSGCTLTGCFSRFLPDPHPGLPELDLRGLWLNSAALNIDDLQHLFSIIQSNKLPQLDTLDLSDNTLTGCLASFLTDPHPGLPELQTLNIGHTSLNKEDLQHLLSIAHKLPKLHKMDLSWYTLTGCLSNFLPDPHPGLPELRELDLFVTALNIEDLQHLFSIIQLNKLPQLYCLNLSLNTLTGCLSNFLSDPHPGLPELQKLYLNRTEINKEDLQHLFSITHSNKLPNLQILDLSNNTLTGHLSSFLPDSHPGIPELEELDLRDTELNKAGLQHLTHLIQTHKLPGLKDLHLGDNRLSEMEMAVEHLIEACVAHHQKELKLILWGNGLSVAFEEKWKQRCAETKIKLFY